MDRPTIKTEDATVIFIEDDLCHFHFFTTDHEIGVESVKRIHDVIKEHKQAEKCYLIISTEPGASMTQEARDYASSQEFDEIAIADAIIRADYSHEMAANFFIRFNRPKRPVRLFPDKDHAVAWINGLRDGKSINNNVS